MENTIIRLGGKQNLIGSAIIQSRSGQTVNEIDSSFKGISSEPETSNEPDWVAVIYAGKVGKSGKVEEETRGSEVKEKTRLLSCPRVKI